MRVSRSRSVLQVRLHADAHVRKAGPGAAIDVECRVGIGARLHVDPDPGLVGRRALDEGHQTGLADGAAEIEPELRELDRDLGVERGLFRARQDLEIVPRHLLRLFGLLHVFAEVGENGPDAGRPERTGGGEGRLQVLSRHEARHGAVYESEFHRPLAQPAALRAREKSAPEEAHG